MAISEISEMNSRSSALLPQQEIGADLVRRRGYRRGREVVQPGRAAADRASSFARSQRPAGRHSISSVSWLTVPDGSGVGVPLAIKSFVVGCELTPRTFLGHSGISALLPTSLPSSGTTVLQFVRTAALPTHRFLGHRPARRGSTPSRIVEARAVDSVEDVAALRSV